MTDPRHTLTCLYEDIVEELNNALDTSAECMKPYDIGYCRALAYAADRIFDELNNLNSPRISAGSNNG